MFIKSTKQKEYTYKVLRVFKNEPDSRPFTTLVLYSKKPDGTILNAEVTVWETLNAEVGDMVALYDISSVDYEEKDKGYSLFKTIKIKSSQVKVIKEKIWKKN